MDCYNSFNITIKGSNTFTGGDVKTWLVGTDNNFSIRWGTSSTFNPQGFKNINIFGVDVIGSIQTLPTSLTGGVVVNDWYQDLFINGQIPILSGTVTAAPNFWNIDSTSTQAANFAIGKYTSSIKFASPIQSVRSIVFEEMRAQGNSVQTVGSVNLAWDLNYIFYYQFEGE